MASCIKIHNRCKIEKIKFPNPNLRVKFVLWQSEAEQRTKTGKLKNVILYPINVAHRQVFW